MSPLRNPREELREFQAARSAIGTQGAYGVLRSCLEACAQEVDQQLHRQLVSGLMREVLDCNQKLKQTLEQVTRLSVTDQLTGLYNRRRILEILHSEYLRFQRMGSSAALILFDIDHFKKINDTFGHDVGDRALVAVARTASKTVRNIDTLARWGGEEFLVVCPGTTTEHALILAERLRSGIGAEEDPAYGRVTCSFGVNAFAPEVSEEVAVQRADQALYSAKSHGRNRVESFPVD